MITAEEARKIVDIIKPEIESYLKIIEAAVIEAASSGKYTTTIEHCLTDCDAPGHEYDKRIMNAILNVLHDCGYHTKVDAAKYSYEAGDTLFICTNMGRLVVDFSEE